VAAEPAYAGIIEELLWCSDGQELYLRKPAACHIRLGKCGV